jgi:hypothetical protein
MRICVTCGVQQPPFYQTCPICNDQRQFVGFEGQQWTTPANLRAGHRNTIEQLEDHVFSFWSQPKFAIGQRCLLIQTPHGNILWDCISLLDDQTIGQIMELGGISAIAISHPHYYSTFVDWSHAFGTAPVFIHRDDGQWVMRPDPCIQLWNGETLPLNPDMTLIRCGGHFEGAQVLHWTAGALFSGDVIQVVPDRRWVSFMRSYPNYIPLPPSKVRQIAAAVKPFNFDRLYGAWPKFEILSDANGAVQRSADRYIQAVTD